MLRVGAEQGHIQGQIFRKKQISPEEEEKIWSEKMLGKVSVNNGQVNAWTNVENKNTVHFY